MAVWDLISCPIIENMRRNKQTMGQIKPVFYFVSRSKSMPVIKSILLTVINLGLILSNFRQLFRKVAN